MRSDTARLSSVLTVWRKLSTSSTFCSCASLTQIGCNLVKASWSAASDAMWYRQINLCTDINNFINYLRTTVIFVYFSCKHSELEWSWYPITAQRQCGNDNRCRCLYKRCKHKPKFHLLRHTSRHALYPIYFRAWQCRMCCAAHVTTSATSSSRRARQARYATLFVMW